MSSSNLDPGVLLDGIQHSCTLNGRMPAWCAAKERNPNMSAEEAAKACRTVDRCIHDVYMICRVRCSVTSPIAHATPSRRLQACYKPTATCRELVPHGFAALAFFPGASTSSGRASIKSRHGGHARYKSGTLLPEYDFGQQDAGDRMKSIF